MFQEAMIVTTRNLASWGAALIGELVNDFGRQGCRAVIVDLAAVERSQTDHLLDRWCEKSPEKLLISLNARLTFPEHKPGGSVYEVGWSHFCWLFDNPSHNYENLTQLPADAVVGLAEASHLDSMKALHLPHTCTVFSYRPDSFGETPVPTGARSHKILIAGNASALPNLEHTKNGNPVELHPYIDAAWAAGHQQARIPAPTVSLFQAACADTGHSPDALPKSILASLISIIEQLSNTHSRLRTINILVADHQVSLIGNLQGYDFERAENVNYLGATDYETFENMLGNSQVTLNLTPKFTQVATPRVWSALKAGAVPLTTASAELDPYKTAGVLDYLDLSLDDGDLRDAMIEMLDDETVAHRLESIANRSWSGLEPPSRIEALYSAFMP